MIKQIKKWAIFKAKLPPSSICFNPAKHAALGSCEHKCHILITLPLFAESTEASKTEIKSSYGCAWIKHSAVFYGSDIKSESNWAASGCSVQRTVRSQPQALLRSREHRLGNSSACEQWAGSLLSLRSLRDQTCSLLHAGLCLPSRATRQRTGTDKPLVATSSQKPTVPKWVMLTHKMCAGFLLKMCYFSCFPTSKMNLYFSFNKNQYSYNQLFFDNCSTYSIIIYLSEYWLYCNFHFSRFTCVSQLSYIRLHSVVW